MKQRWLKIIISGAFLFGLGLAMMLLFNGVKIAQPTAVFAQQQTANSVTVKADTAQLAGDYRGTVDLQFVVAGVYSDTLAAPPPPAEGAPELPDLGAIDLALNLTQTNDAVSGYVNLDRTLVFLEAHTIPNGGSTLKIGPYVNGSFDGTNLTIVSEQVAATLSGQPIQRQFRLTGAIVASDGSQISGEYRETLWGATREPVTVVGTFMLQRPVFATGAPDPGNQAPDIVADSATTTRGISVTIDVLANDGDVDGDTLTITSVSKPQFGTATTNGQNVTYRPNVTFVGEDNFSYFVSDGQGNTAAGSVTVTVEPGNGPVSYESYLPLIMRP